MFLRPVQFRNPDGSTNTGYIDLYRGGSFVLETKQGCEAKQAKTLTEQAGLRPARRRRGHGVRGTGAWDAAMLRARGQAEQYAKALPDWPPFLIVVDVGHSIETYADFTGTGKHYAQFPDTNGPSRADPSCSPGSLHRAAIAFWRILSARTRRGWRRPCCRGFWAAAFSLRRNAR